MPQWLCLSVGCAMTFKKVFQNGLQPTNRPKSIRVAVSPPYVPMCVLKHLAMLGFIFGGYPKSAICFHHNLRDCLLFFVRCFFYIFCLEKQSRRNFFDTDKHGHWSWSWLQHSWLHLPLELVTLQLHFSQTHHSSNRQHPPPLQPLGIRVIPTPPVHRSGFNAL